MKLKERLIVKLAGLLKVNLLGTAYKARGIGLPNDFRQNGEYYFLQNTLKNLIEKRSSLTFFDVGQNRGDYTQALIDLYPDANIHGFEPNHHLTDILSERFKHNQNIRLNNFGLGSKKENLSLFAPVDNTTTGHGSVFKSVMTELHHNTQLEEIEVKLNTISNYCREHDIKQIDFLKIDVEGNELNVLQGAGDYLDRIRVIQFEFNEMNIASKSFLKDFYDLMPGYTFFRLLPEGLFPLKDYSSKNESFIIQNIIAFNTTLAEL